MFSKTDHAYDVMRRQILDGTYKPGEQLRLSKIAEELELSEMPVREALRLLQKDGLVVMSLHRSARVAKLSFERAWEIEKVRLHLEALACLTAAPYHDAASISRLHVLLDELKEDLDRPVLIARRNRAFHTEMMSKAPNDFLREHIEELWDRAWQYSSASFFDFMPHRISELLVEDARMLRLIEKGDLEGLEAFLQKRLVKIDVGWRKAVAKTQASSVPA